MSHRPDSGRRRQLVLPVIALTVLAAMAFAAARAPGVEALACPPYCPTPIITPSWHLHMCDKSYEEQQGDNHCMNGPGVTEFPAGTDRVYAIYCHKLSDTVAVQIKDSGGGLQYVNHPDGVTYTGEGCESLLWWPRYGIPAAGSPYFTSASWPEGPFTGVGAGIEWFIGLFVAFDQEIYYGNHAEALITARDPAADLNPTAVDTITVRVTSTSDPVGIELTLSQDTPGFPVFKLERALRFSQMASNQAQGVIQVANRDTVTVSYCPRACKQPYTDTATWYLFEVTITPTPLPTWPGPPPTLTPTPPPDLDVEYITLRPAPADVGYVPEVSTNKERPNHLGYPSVFSGMWTRGTNKHYGMVQFDLSPVPEGARIMDARLEMVGRESRFAKGGSWQVALLDPAIDPLWRSATFDVVHDTPVVGAIGPPLTDVDLAVGRANGVGFSPDQLALLGSRLVTTRRASFRIDGPDRDENNLFAWHSGVDVFGRDPEPPDPALGPALHLAYSLPGEPGEPTPTWEPGVPTAIRTATGTLEPSPTLTGTASPSPTARADVPTRTVAAPPGTATSGRQLCVLAFDDRDGDTMRDVGERLLPGVTIQLTHRRSGAFVSRTTDGANVPDYCWDGLTDGGYDLTVTALPGGYEASGASERRTTVPLAVSPALFEFGARQRTTPTSRPTASPTPSPGATEVGPATATPPRAFRHSILFPMVLRERVGRR